MKRVKIFRSRILIIAIVIAVGYFCVKFFTSQTKINSQQAEINRLMAQYESLTAANDELEDRIARGKDPENYEQAAREQYSYIYPDERVYVVTP